MMNKYLISWTDEEGEYFEMPLFANARGAWDMFYRKARTERTVYLENKNRTIASSYKYGETMETENTVLRTQTTDDEIKFINRIGLWLEKHDEIPLGLF